MFEIAPVTPTLLPREPERGARCVAWYWQRGGSWTGAGWRDEAGWSKCLSRARKLRDVAGEAVPVCAVHARPLHIEIRNLAVLPSPADETGGAA